MKSRDRYLGTSTADSDCRTSVCFAISNIISHLLVAPRATRSWIATIAEATPGGAVTAGTIEQDTIDRAHHQTANAAMTDEGNVHHTEAQHNEGHLTAPTATETTKEVAETQARLHHRADPATDLHPDKPSTTAARMAPAQKA